MKTFIFFLFFSIFINRLYYSQCGNTYVTPSSNGSCGEYFYHNLSGNTGTWNFGDGNTSTSINGTHTYTSNGGYLVTLTAGNCMFQDSIFITCFSGTGCGNTYITPSNNQTCGEYFYHNLSGQTGTWNFGDGNTSSATNGTHTYTSNGTYNVTLTAGNCSFTDSVAISCFATDLSEFLNEKNINIYPNPCDKVLNVYIDTNNDFNYSIQLLDLTGKIVFNNKAEVYALNSINVSQLSKGIYILRIRSLNDNIILNKRFIKR